jgi:RES domain-containing protein
MSSTHSRGRAAAAAGEAHSGKPVPSSYLIDWRTALSLAERACCCPSRPAVVVIIPSGPSRNEPAELFLCRHHHLASEQALERASAAVFDVSGVPLTAHTRTLTEAAS